MKRLLGAVCVSLAVSATDPLRQFGLNQPCSSLRGGACMVAAWLVIWISMDFYCWMKNE